MPIISQMFTWLFKKKYIRKKSGYLPAQGKKEFYPIAEYLLIVQ